jgi:hypothetical protein
MAIEVGKTFWRDTFRLQVFATIPACIRGLIAPRRRPVRLPPCCDAGQFKVRLVRLCWEYGSDPAAKRDRASS